MQTKEQVNRIEAQADALLPPMESRIAIASAIMSSLGALPNIIADWRELRAENAQLRTGTANDKQHIALLFKRINELEATLATRDSEGKP